MALGLCDTRDSAWLPGVHQLSRVPRLPAASSIILRTWLSGYPGTCRVVPRIKVKSPVDVWPSFWTCSSVPRVRVSCHLCTTLGTLETSLVTGPTKYYVLHKFTDRRQTFLSPREMSARAVHLTSVSMHVVFVCVPYLVSGGLSPPRLPSFCSDCPPLTLFVLF